MVESSAHTPIPYYEPTYHVKINKENKTTTRTNSTRHVSERDIELLLLIINRITYTPCLRGCNRLEMYTA